MNRIAGLREAAKTGRPFDLAGGIADDESDPPDTGDGVAARELAAEDIRAVLLEPGLTADAQGFQIRGAIVTGTLNLDYAKIPCRLMFNHCRFESAPTFEQAILPALALTHVLLPGLNLDGADIRGNVTLDEVKATGEVRAVAAQIGGQLILENKVKLSNPGGEALSLDSVDIRGSVYMSGIEVTGRVRAVQARMHRQLYLMGSTLRNTEEALVLDGADIAGGVFMQEAEVVGEVRAVGTHIGGVLALGGAIFRNPETSNKSDAMALNLENATVDLISLTDVSLPDEGFTADGGMELSSASIRVLSVGRTGPANRLPRLFGAQGWTLDAVNGSLRTDRTSARDWLDTIPTPLRTDGRKEFAAQPWKELAKIYDQIGQPEDARRLRFWAARRVTKAAPWTSKFVRWPYAFLVGYGYYPLIILVWLTVLWCAVFVWSTVNASAFAPMQSPGSTITNYPPFNPGLFAMDTAFPAFATGQANFWRITGNTLPVILVAIKAFAWLLIALLLAGITGILRKD